MGKYLKKLIIILVSIIKIVWIKLWNGKKLNASLLNALSISAQIEIEKDGFLQIGKMLKMRKNSKLCVRKGASITVGENFFMNENCSIISHQNISIGKNVMLGPGVLVYDHDHDFSQPEGLYAMKYKTAPVMIGNNVWIGANTVILRGTTIGDNCVVAAGSVIKGTYPNDTMIYQKRITNTKKIERNI